MKSFLVIAMTLLSTASFAEVYNLDTTASRIEWKAGKKLGDSHNGEVKVKSGKFETDDKGMVKKASVIADMKTITSEDLKDNPKYQKMLVDHLSNEDFFNVQKYPESTFELTNIAPKAGLKDEFTVKGNLTMNGKTMPLEFPAKISSDKKSIVGTANVKIERLKWDLKYGSSSLFKSLSADKIINDTFDLTLKLVAKK